MATGLAVMATAAANNDSEGDTNLGTVAAGPIGTTCGTSARKERCREKILPFVTQFWSSRTNEGDKIDHKKEAMNKRMSNYWMVRALGKEGVRTLVDVEKYIAWANRGDPEQENQRLELHEQKLDAHIREQDRIIAKLKTDEEDALLWKGKALDMKEEVIGMKKEVIGINERSLDMKEKQLDAREKELKDPKYLAKLVNNDPRYLALLADHATYDEKMMKILADYESNLAYLRGSNAADARTEGYSAGVDAGFDAANEMNVQKRKQEDAEQQQAEVQQERSVKKQKQANKKVKQKRRDWNAGVEADNKQFNTPKGSGSSSRR